MSTPNTPKPAAEAGAIVSSLPAVPVIPPKPTVSAAKALGLPENPGKTVQDVTKELRKNQKLDAVFSKPEAQKKASAKKEEKPSEAANPLNGESAPAPVEAQITPAAAPEKKEEPKAPAPAPEPPKEIPEIAELKKQNEELKKQFEEVQKLLKGKQETPAAPATPAKDPEAEKKAAEEIKIARGKYLKDTAAALEILPLSEADHDAILEGGPKAVEKLTEIRRNDISLAILRARETIYEDLNPVVEEFRATFERFEPVFIDYQNLQRLGVENRFKEANPELAPHLPLCKQVANALLTRYPKECEVMEEKQFFAEVKRQTEGLMKTLGIAMTAPASTPAPAPAAPAPQANPPAPVAQQPATPPTPAPTPKPPAASAPATAGSGAGRSSFAKSVAATLV